ncbi:hypothetical protein KI387_030588, partial [Taxus chinensis]
MMWMGIVNSFSAGKGGGGATGIWYHVSKFPQCLSLAIDLVPTLKKNYGIRFEKAEKIGFGLLPSPEDLVVDGEKKSFFTGCGDGWIKWVWIHGKGDKQPVENRAFVGGQTLGVALGPNQELIVCELTQTNSSCLASSSHNEKDETGEAIKCSPDQREDLFYAILGGLGQYGIITKARIMLQKAPDM